MHGALHCCAFCSNNASSPLGCPMLCVVASYWWHYSITVAFFFSTGQKPAGNVERGREADTDGAEAAEQACMLHAARGGSS